MALQEQELFAQQATTAAASAYSPGAGETAIIKQITVCNHEATAQTWGLWIDNDGSTYDDNSVKFEDVPIPANTTEVISCFYAMNNVAGNLAIKANSNSMITFSGHGAIIT